MNKYELKVIKTRVKLTFSTDILGSTPKNKEVYASFIKARAEESAKKSGKQTDDELETVQETEERGWTGFHADDEGLLIYDYVVRGLLKEAATALQSTHGVQAIKSKIDKYVFVGPRRIQILRDGRPIKEPDGICERPLRAMTMQGPRVTLARSDMVSAGKGQVTLEFDITILPNESKKGDGVTLDLVKFLLSYGQYQGMGQWRNASNGRFTVEFMD